jgi:3-dehydroquinate dehydratase/shikimate dehydrogenase
MKNATLVAAVDREITSPQLQAASAAAAWLEIRGDRFEADPLFLRRHFPGTLLFTLRSAHAGGRSRLMNGARREQLQHALAAYDLVDLEPEDLGPLTLAAIPPERRVLTLVTDTTDDDELRAKVGKLLETPARLYRLVCRPRGYADALRPLRLLKLLERDDVVAFADGPLGTWTRLLAPHLGAPFVFAAIEGTVAADGVPTIAQLVSDYGLPQMMKVEELFGIAGDPIFSSLSPRLHNAAFRLLGRCALYLPFHVPSFPDFWGSLVASHALDALGLPIRAICVVSPYKEIALAAADAKTPMVHRAMSTNFFIREGEEWTADTTDPAGVMQALSARGVDVGKMPVAVVGCGGSGRAIAAALQQAGAEVTLVNRGFDRASLAVRLLRLPFLPLAGFSPERFGLVVNATPLGRDGDELPFAPARMRADAVVIDLVYGQRPTPLVAQTRERGQVTIDGKEILMRQAMSQFRLMTGQEMPEALVRALLGLTMPAPAAEVSGSRVQC